MVFFQTVRMYQLAVRYCMPLKIIKEKSIEQVPSESSRTALISSISSLLVLYCLRYFILPLADSEPYLQEFSMFVVLLIDGSEMKECSRVFD